MKQTKLLFGFAIFLAAGISACSDDTPAPDTGVAQEDEIRYLNVTISDAYLGSRAASFEEGTSTENYVNSIRMDFYDEAGNYITKADPSDITWNPVNGNKGNKENIEKVGTATVMINVKKDQNLPAYVMCYINPVDWGESASATKMEDLRNIERPSYKASGSDYFAMNNSCYYGTNALNGQQNVKISGTPILESQLLKTKPSDTDNANDTNRLNIYVERYAAKVKFSLETNEGVTTEGAAQSGIYPYTGTTKVGENDIAYSLKFNPEAWTINADAPSMFAVKKFALTDNGAIPSESEVDSYLSPWTSWNDEGNKRSYWSCSPAFFATEFPQVSDQIADQMTAEQIKNKNYGAGAKVGNYKLLYYSYNQICGTNSTSTGKGNTDFKAETDGTLPCRYAMENTMGKAAFSSLNPKAAVPSVLIVGNYSITYGGTPIPANTSFYIFNNSNDNGLYFESQPQNAENARLIKDKFIDVQEILFIKSEGKYIKLTNTNGSNNLNNLMVKHPAKDVRGENLVPHRYVTLQIENLDNGAEMYYKGNGTNTYVKVTDTNLNFVNTLLWQQTGVASSYKSGKCYYTIPIEHLRMTEDVVTDEDKAPKNQDGKINWKNLRVGDLGLVRNHVYQLNVSVITGLATGIENLDYPIVPPMDVDEYHVKYKINILGWRVVPEQKNIIL